MEGCATLAERLQLFSRAAAVELFEGWKDLAINKVGSISGALNLNYVVVVDI